MTKTITMKFAQLSKCREIRNRLIYGKHIAQTMRQKMSTVHQSTR